MPSLPRSAHLNVPLFVMGATQAGHHAYEVNETAATGAAAQERWGGELGQWRGGYTPVSNMEVEFNAVCGGKSSS